MSSKEPWKLAIGKRVMVKEKGEGTVLYYGFTKKSKEEKKLGIELDSGLGKHDGQVNGVRYFTCTAGAGILTSTENVKLIDDAARSTRKSVAKSSSPKKGTKTKSKAIAAAKDQEAKAQAEIEAIQAKLTAINAADQTVVQDPRVDDADAEMERIRARIAQLERDENTDSSSTTTTNEPVAAVDIEMEQIRLKIATLEKEKDAISVAPAPAATTHDSSVPSSSEPADSQVQNNTVEEEAEKLAARRIEEESRRLQNEQELLRQRLIEENQKQLEQMANEIKEKAAAEAAAAVEAERQKAAEMAKNEAAATAERELDKMKADLAAAEEARVHAEAERERAVVAAQAAQGASSQSNEVELELARTKAEMERIKQELEATQSKDQPALPANDQQNLSGSGETDQLRILQEKLKAAEEAKTAAEKKNAEDMKEYRLMMARKVMARIQGGQGAVEQIKEELKAKEQEESERATRVAREEARAKEAEDRAQLALKAAYAAETRIELTGLPESGPARKEIEKLREKLRETELAKQEAMTIAKVAAEGKVRKLEETKVRWL